MGLRTAFTVEDVSFTFAEVVFSQAISGNPLLMGPVTAYVFGGFPRLGVRPLCGYVAPVWGSRGSDDLARGPDG